MQDAFDEIAPGTQQTESETAEEKPVTLKNLCVLIQISNTAVQL